MRINLALLVSLLILGSIFGNLSANQALIQGSGSSITITAVSSWNESLAQRNKDLIRLARIGRSEQGRHITLATITNFKQSANRPHVWFDGAIHGSE